MYGQTDQPDLRVLEPTENQGYGLAPIPTARDEQISRLLDEVSAAGALARFARSLDSRYLPVLRVYAERMASEAVRRRDPEILRRGLIALLLVSDDGDRRDTLTIYPLFTDAIERIECDAPSFLEQTRQVIGDVLIAPFAQYLRRPPEKRNLKSMGYVTGADADGFRYLRTW